MAVWLASRVIIVPILAPSCKLKLARFSAELRIQDGAECGNNVKVIIKVIIKALKRFRSRLSKSRSTTRTTFVKLKNNSHLATTKRHHYDKKKSKQLYFTTAGLRVTINISVDHFNSFIT